MRASKHDSKDSCGIEQMKCRIQITKVFGKEASIISLLNYLQLPIFIFYLLFALIPDVSPASSQLFREVWKASFIITEMILMRNVITKQLNPTIYLRDNTRMFYWFDDGIELT